MILHNWWYNILEDSLPLTNPLDQNINADVLIIGGGIAGLHAALTLANSSSFSKSKIVLLEKDSIGGSSSGRSSGFLTPESELQVSDLIKRYGKHDAKIVWDCAQNGVTQIVSNIKKYKIDCDLEQQDSFYVGIGAGGLKDVQEEVDARKEIGFQYEHYTTKNIKKLNPGKGYTAALRYGESYGFTSLKYTRDLKKVLLEKGVKIYEGTEVLSIDHMIAKTHLGSVKAKKIIVCIDKMLPNIHKISKKVYHAQTFLSVSEPLEDEDIKKIFPTDKLMCWDTKLVYSYYRLTTDKRLLLGGGSPITTYYPDYYTGKSIMKGVISDFKNRFPALEHIKFTHFWPGLIDITKDLMPIADYDPNNKDVQFVLGCPGLPWAAFCGSYVASRLTDAKTPDHSKFFSANKQSFISEDFQKYIGKPISFAISNLHSLYGNKKE